MLRRWRADKRSGFSIRPAAADAEVAARNYVDSWNASFGEPLAQSDRTVVGALRTLHNGRLAAGVPHRIELNTMTRMPVETFADRVRKLPVGKSVGGAVYLHRDALERHDAGLFGIVCSIASAAEVVFTWNVCKLSPYWRRVSLLLYPEFRSDAHPVLAAAASISLNGTVGTTRHYSPSGNRPILHRKELLLDVSDPDYGRFAVLTDQEERAGLFSAPTTIGHERGWSKRLEERGLIIRGHRLLRVGEADGSTT